MRRTLMPVFAALAAFSVGPAPAASNAPLSDTPPGPDSPREGGSGDPVGVVTGNVYDRAVDLSVSTPGVPLELRRSYSSADLGSSDLGGGWCHSLGWTLSETEGGVTVRSAGEAGATDACHTFSAVSNGCSVANADGYALSRTEDGLYTLLTPDRLSYSFDAAGRLASVFSWTGDGVSVERDPGSGRILRAGHTCGKSLSFEYGPAGLVSRVTTPDPSVWASYEYSEGKRGDMYLSTVVRSCGDGEPSVNRYRYEAIPRSGSRATSVSNVAAAGGGGGGVCSMTVPSLRSVRPQGEEEDEEPRRSVLAWKSDANGMWTEYAYDRRSDAPAVCCTRSCMRDGLFEETFSTWERQATVVRKAAEGRLSRTVIYIDGSRRETVRQTGTERRSREYDGNGDLVREEVRDTSSRHSLVTVRSYDVNHREASVGTAFDAEPDAFASIEWDERMGVPRRVVTPEGRVGEFFTNGTEVVVCGAGADDPRLVTTVSCTTNWRPSVVTGPDGRRTEYSYGGDGLVSRVETDGLPSVGMSYDALGNLASVSLPGPGGEFRTVAFANNGRGSPVSVSHPDGTSEAFAYDRSGSKVVRHVDRLGREDAYRWVLGLCVHAGRVVGGVTNTLFGVEHDRQLNVVSITDPLGRRAESYALDANDRVVAVTNVEGQAMARSYAVGGLVASETRFDGTEVSFGYDSRANLATVAYPGETLSFSRDADGLLTSAAGGAGLVTNLYDAATGWLDASRGADGTWVSYARSDGGAVTSVTSVAGTTACSLDAAGRRIRLAMPSGEFRFGYCEWNGRLESVTNGSGLVVSYAYDVMDRVTNVSWRTTGGATLGGFDYEYDALGRVTSRGHALGDPSRPSSPMSQSSQRSYAYDDLDRLASDGDVVYTYDAAGNRMTRTEDGETTACTLGVGDRLASWTGGSYTHDAAGCVTRIERDGRPTLDLTWDGRYQLVSVSTNGVFAESYSYDALGRRVSTTTLEGTTRHVYDDGWQVIADIDEQGEVVASYVWGEGIDRLLAVTVGGATYYALTDIQGTVWGYVDSQNSIVARFDYDAWGNVLSDCVVPSAATIATLRYRFQGRERSAATGLINFRMRWYDAETGRWLSKDPIGLSGGLNLYAFCGGDPMNNSDPNGDFVVAIGGVGAAGGSTGGSLGSGIVIGVSMKNGLQVGTYQTGSFGSHVGLDASFGTGITIAPGADDICDIAGTAASAGGSGGVAASFGAEATVPLNGNPKGTSITFSGGVGIGAEGHITITHTFVQKLW